MVSNRGSIRQRGRSARAPSAASVNALRRHAPKPPIAGDRGTAERLVCGCRGTQRVPTGAMARGLSGLPQNQSATAEDLPALRCWGMTVVIIQPRIAERSS
jgi:hypothetical protein